MRPSPELSARIEAEIRALRTEPELHVDAVARRHGALPLLGDLFVDLVLRPDGTVLEVEWESDHPPAVASSETALIGLLSGAKRYPWLAELLPVRPPEAVDCPDCAGRGKRMFDAPFNKKQTILCGRCGGLGWLVPRQETRAVPWPEG